MHYCELLALTSDRRDEFLALFGDETAPYDQARQRHYAAGPRSPSRGRFISGYAAMHPLEDFAEVFAHFLHIADTLQTAHTFGLLPDGPSTGLTASSMHEVIAGSWLPLTKGLNQINRSMGRGDLYPSVHGQPVISKLAFVADLVAR